MLKLLIKNLHYRHVMSLLFFLLFCANPFKIVEAAETTPDTIAPSITINAIKKDTQNYQITGKVSDNFTLPEQINLKLVDKNKAEIASITPTTAGTWSIERPLTEKLNKLYLLAKDSSFNEASIVVQRPFIKAINMSVLKYRHKIYQSDGSAIEEDVRINVNLLENDDISRVAVDSDMTIEFSDEIFLDPTNLAKQIIIFNNEGKPDVGITSAAPNVVKLTNIQPSTTYYFMINPALITGGSSTSLLIDTDGNMVFPIIKKFTTVSETVKNTGINEYSAEIERQPHGFYSTNVNSCGNCHNTHNAKNAKLDEPIESYNNTTQDSYCMACHDGTTTAPMLENNLSNQVSKHNSHRISTDPSKKTSGSCSSCHNPHLTWSEDNPNLLKSHYVYTHNDATNRTENYPLNQVIDSRVQSCETCHGKYTGFFKQMAEDNTNGTAYKVLHYRKSSTAIGTTDDTDLCFSCHNLENEIADPNTKNILKFYEDQNSMHRINALDGSNLNGNIPCAECHDTHGSSNIKLLKEKLGIENQQSFTATTEDWDATKEKDFCTKCHTGTATVSGVIAKKYDANDSNHNGTQQTCSECHSGDSKSMLEAAHAPKRNGTQ